MVKFTLFASKQSLESHINNQAHVGDLFWPWGHCSSGICLS